MNQVLSIIVQNQKVIEGIINMKEHSSDTKEQSELATNEKPKKKCKFCDSEELIEFWSPLNHEFNNINTGLEYRKFRFCNSCGRSQAISPITRQEIIEHNKAVRNGSKLTFGLLLGIMGAVTIVSLVSFHFGWLKP